MVLTIVQTDTINILLTVQDYNKLILFDMYIYKRKKIHTHINFYIRYIPNSVHGRNTIYIIVHKTLLINVFIILI